jgi:ABC-type polysaccharide/polyol phosphate transport system ATPase subunit
VNLEQAKVSFAPLKRTRNENGSAKRNEPDPCLQGRCYRAQGVNLSVYENEIVSIVGQNGSGKTTLVRHFNGLLRPTSGSVSLLASRRRS